MMGGLMGLMTNVGPFGEGISLLVMVAYWIRAQFKITEQDRKQVSREAR